MIKILQVSVVTQTVLGGLTKVANFLKCIHVKMIKNGWKYIQLLQKQAARLTFWPTL